MLNLFFKFRFILVLACSKNFKRHDAKFCSVTKLPWCNWPIRSSCMQTQKFSVWSGGGAPKEYVGSEVLWIFINLVPNIELTFFKDGQLIKIKKRHCFAILDYSLIIHCRCFTRCDRWIPCREMRLSRNLLAIQLFAGR